MVPEEVSTPRVQSYPIYIDHQGEQNTESLVITPIRVWSLKWRRTLNHKVEWDGKRGSVGWLVQSKTPSGSRERPRRQRSSGVQWQSDLWLRRDPVTRSLRIFTGLTVTLLTSLDPSRGDLSGWKYRPARRTKNSSLLRVYHGGPSNRGTVLGRGLTLDGRETMRWTGSLRVWYPVWIHSHRL